MSELNLKELLDEQEITQPDTTAAFRRFVEKHGNPAPRPSRKPAVVGFGIAFAIVALLSFAPARSLGQRILSMLRVQKVAIVPIDMEAISTTTDGRQKVLSQLISDQVTVTIKPGDPTVESSPDAASQAAGFAVLTLPGLGEPSRIVVRDESAFHITLDRDRVAAILDAAGRSDIPVPANVDGALIAVHVPKGVDMTYGSCSGASQEGCIHFAQVPVPAISIPPSLDMASLAEAALQLGGMSAAQATAFCQTVDWSSTLVIPVPRNSSSTRTVSVAGVNGTLVQEQGRRGAGYALIWVKNRQIFALTGNGAPDQALAVAESLN